MLPSLILPSSAFAWPSTFYCKVVELQEVARDGSVVRGTAEQKKQIGSTFSVKPVTGEIRGNYFIHNERTTDVDVIDSGKDHYFYVISKSSGPHIYASYLSIFGFINKNGKYPFTYTSSGRYIYTGICE